MYMFSCVCLEAGSHPWVLFLGSHLHFVVVVETGSLIEALGIVIRLDWSTSKPFQNCAYKNISEINKKF